VPEPDAYHANLQRGTILLDHNRPKEALPFIQAALAANPDAPYAYAELARCWNEIPPDRHKSIDAINRAIGLAPHVSHFHGRKGWFCVCLLQYRAAKKAADAGLAIDPNCITSLNALANAHTKLGQWKKAEEACHRILALNPNDAPALNLLAQAYRHQGRWKESRETVARLLANLPDNAFGHANAGYGALAAGDHLRANEHFLTSLRLDPHFDLARRGLLSSLRSRIWILRFNHRIAASVQNTSNLNAQAVVLLSMFAAVILACLLIHDLGPLAPVAAYCLAFGVIGGVLLYLVLSVIVAFLANFFLLFDPLGRHALTTYEKIVACLPIVPFAVFSIALISAGAWILVLVMSVILALVALSIQFPLLKDRWLRRREATSID
jgi:tetratricopeptide (TPR) repeat protein